MGVPVLALKHISIRRPVPSRTWPNEYVGMFRRLMAHFDSRLQRGKCDASIHLVFAYFGPETVMPVTSILATVAAVVLMFGKSLFRLVAYWVRRASFRGRHGQASAGPHFGLGRRRAQHE